MLPERAAASKHKISKTLDIAPLIDCCLCAEAHREASKAAVMARQLERQLARQQGKLAHEEASRWAAAREDAT